MMILASGSAFIAYVLIKLIDVLHQLDSKNKVLDLNNKNLQTLIDNNEDSNALNVKTATIDHSFAKRVADEIVRMQTNLSRMDDSIRGYKQINASVRKLEQSLNSNQYELEDLLNKPYNIGMNLEATIIVDEKLEKGESIITRIIKPQINYKGKLIQAAHVEVSESE